MSESPADDKPTLTPEEEAKRWKKQADGDFRTATLLFQNNDYDACAFQCQQAAEKALKALLYSKGQKIFGHSLVSLLSLIINEGFSAPTATVKNAAKRLDKHYTASRYPDALGDQLPDEYYTRAMAEETLQWAELLLQYSGENLP